MKKFVKGLIFGALAIPCVIAFAGCGEKPKTEEQNFQEFKTAFVGTYNYAGTKTITITTKSLEKKAGQVDSDTQQKEVTSYDDANHVGARLRYEKSEEEGYYKEGEDKTGLFLKDAEYIAQKDNKFVLYQYNREFYDEGLQENKNASYVDADHAKYEFGVFYDESFAALAQVGLSGEVEDFKLFLKTSIAANLPEQTETEPTVVLKFSEEDGKQKMVATVEIETELSPSSLSSAAEQTADATFTFSQASSFTAIYERERLISFEQSSTSKTTENAEEQTTVLSESEFGSTYDFAYTYDASLMPNADELSTYQGVGENGEIGNISVSLDLEFALGDVKNGDLSVFVDQDTNFGDTLNLEKIQVSGEDADKIDIEWYLDEALTQKATNQTKISSRGLKLFGKVTPKENYAIVVYETEIDYMGLQKETRKEFEIVNAGQFEVNLEYESNKNFDSVKYEDKTLTEQDHTITLESGEVVILKCQVTFTMEDLM